MPQGQVTLQPCSAWEGCWFWKCSVQGALWWIAFPHIVVINICQNMIHRHLIFIDARRNHITLLLHLRLSFQIMLFIVCDQVISGMLPCSLQNINTETNWKGLLKDNEPWSIMMLSHGLKPEKRSKNGLLKLYLFPTHMFYHHTYNNGILQCNCSTRQPLGQVGRCSHCSS